MKLLYSKGSPFVRKVLVLAHEHRLIDRIELVPVNTTPVASDGLVVAHNPTGKIPTLLLDDGAALFDSRVIVEHLDSLSPGIIPADPLLRRRALVRQALADAIADAAVLPRYETFLRPEALRWPEWIAGQWAKVDRGLDQLEPELEPDVDALDVGHVAVGCALGYLDFRFADRPWRTSRPRLAAWFERLAERPSMRATEP